MGSEELPKGAVSAGLVAVTWSTPELLAEGSLVNAATAARAALVAISVADCSTVRVTID